MDNTQVQKQLNDARAQAETIQQGINRLPTANIPISAIENNTPAPLQIPETPQLTTSPQAGLAQATTMLDQRARELQQTQQGQIAQSTEVENRIKEIFGLTSQEGADRAKLQQKVLSPMEERLDKVMNSIFQQQLALNQFDMDNVNTIEQMRVDAGKRDITKRTFGAQSAEAGIQMAVQRANMSANLYGSLATADMLQRDYDRAAKNIDRALEAHYEPLKKQMELEMFFLQRLDKRLEGTQKQLADAKMMQIQREFRTIDMAEDAAVEATRSGFATEQELQRMVELADSPKELERLANDILGRGNTQMRDFQMWAQRTQIGIQQAGLDMRREELAEQKIANAINATRQMTQEGRKEVFASNEYKVAQVVSQYQNDLYTDLESAGVKKDNGDIDWDKVSQNDALRYSIAVSLARASLPDISRFASAEDALQDTSLSQQVQGRINRLIGGKGITPDLLKDAVRSLDARAESAYERLEFRTNEVSQVYGVDQAVLPGVSFNQTITSPEAGRFLDNLVRGMSLDQVQAEETNNRLLDNIWNQIK